MLLYPHNPLCVPRSPLPLLCAVFVDEPKETCNVCWEWTLSGCKNSYYQSDVCNKALSKLESVFEDIGAAGEAQTWEQHVHA